MLDSTTKQWCPYQMGKHLRVHDSEHENKFKFKEKSKPYLEKVR